MDTEYDFVQNVNPTQLLDEIATSGIAVPDYINTEGTSVQIFYVAALSDQDAATLSTVVSAHVANPSYIPTAIQTQINLLTSYLNSPNPTIANTARAIVVANLAPRLPCSLMTSINAQIATKLGG